MGREVPFILEEKVDRYVLTEPMSLIFQTTLRSIPQLRFFFSQE
jgi:hypothetical protein